MTTRTEMSHKRITRLLPGIDQDPIGTHHRLQAPGYMDLIVEVIGAGTDIFGDYQEISLAHYYEQNGDLMRDPEVVVRLYAYLARAMSFQQDGGLQYLSESYAYNQEGDIVGEYPSRRADNDAFLAQWLRNIEAQGHALQVPA